MCAAIQLAPLGGGGSWGLELSRCDLGRQGLEVGHRLRKLYATTEAQRGLPPLKKN